MTWSSRLNALVEARTASESKLFDMKIAARCSLLLLVACGYALAARTGIHDSTGRTLLGTDTHTYKNFEHVPLYANKVGPFHNPTETYMVRRILVAPALVPHCPLDSFVDVPHAFSCDHWDASVL